MLGITNVYIVQKLALLCNKEFATSIHMKLSCDIPYP